MPTPFNHPQAGDVHTPPKYGVRASYTANVADLTAATTTCDTAVTLVEGDLVLLTEQTTGAENGIYEVGEVDSGYAPLTRYERCRSEVGLPPGTMVFISEGTARGNLVYQLTTNAPITLDTTSLTFAAISQVASAPTISDATNIAPIANYKRIVPIPLHSCILATGAPMAVFADGASAVPGTELNNSKAMGIRWNNHATPNAILTSVVVPQDVDVTSDATLKIKASKSGATSGDAVTFTVAAYNQVTGALADADTNYGGATSAMTGTATAKTVQQVTLTLATADLPAVGSGITLTIKPTDGLLGTDDVSIHEMWIEFSPKLT